MYFARLLMPENLHIFEKCFPVLDNFFFRLIIFTLLFDLYECSFGCLLLRRFQTLISTIPSAASRKPRSQPL